MPRYTTPNRRAPKSLKERVKQTLVKFEFEIIVLVFMFMFYLFAKYLSYVSKIASERMLFF